MIDQLQLTNFCQHQDLTLSFHPRMTAIIGANGTGKSNIFSAISGAVTNTWVNAGKKEENISQFANEEDPSRIELHLLDRRGGRARVVRSLRGSRSSLVFGAEDKITGDARITEELMEFLGITDKMFLDYIVVRQGEIAGIFSETAAERAKAFQRLFGTTRAEQIYKFLGESVMEVPDLTLAIDENSLQLTEAQENITTIEGELKRLPPFDKATDQGDRMIVEKWAKKKDLVQRGVRAEIEVNRIQGDLEDIEKRVAQLSGQDRELRQALQGEQEKAEEARVVLSQWSHFKAYIQTKGKLERDLEGLLSEAEFESNALPVEPPDLLDGAGLNAAMEKAEAMAVRVHRGREFVQKFNPDTGVAKCPTCYTPTTNLRENYDRALEALPGIQEEHDRVVRQIHATNDYCNRFRQWGTWNHGHQLRLTQCQSQLKDLQELQPPTDDEEALQKSITTYHTADEAAQEVRKGLEQAQQLLSAQQGRLEVQGKALQDARTEAAQIEVTRDKAGEAACRIEDRLQTNEERARLEGAMVEAQKAATHSAATVDRLRAQQEQGERQRAFNDLVGTVRGAFHRDRTPRRVAQGYLQLLTAPKSAGSMLSINDMLTTFEADFRVEATQDLSFTAHFDDGRVQPANRLSGGQKVVLALAFRVAVNSLFVENLGLLCLDEPTEYLDEHNLGCLKLAFERLRSLSESRGLQVIVITHETELAHLFDRVIEL